MPRYPVSQPKIQAIQVPFHSPTHSMQDTQKSNRIAQVTQHIGSCVLSCTMHTPDTAEGVAQSDALNAVVVVAEVAPCVKHSQRLFRSVRAFSLMHALLNGKGFFFFFFFFFFFAIRIAKQWCNMFGFDSMHPWPKTHSKSQI